MTAPLVRAENVSRSFAGRSGWLARRAEVKAVREVDLTIGRGEALGVEDLQLVHAGGKGTA